VGEDAGPSRFYLQGHQVPWTRIIKEVVTKPVLGVGRFTDPEKMTEIVTKGSPTSSARRVRRFRPVAAKKIEEGRYDDIRVCIGCTCAYHAGKSRAADDLHQNATAGEEYGAAASGEVPKKTSEDSISDRGRRTLRRGGAHAS